MSKGTAPPTAPEALEEPTYYVCHEGVIGVGLHHQQLYGGQQCGDVQGGPPRALQEERVREAVERKTLGIPGESSGLGALGAQWKTPSLLSAHRLRPLRELMGCASAGAVLGRPIFRGLPFRCNP